MIFTKTKAKVHIEYNMFFGKYESMDDKIPSFLQVFIYDLFLFTLYKNVKKTGIIQTKDTDSLNT